MGKFTRKGVLAVLALAALCVGGVELAFCRVAEPAVYDEIVAPVRWCGEKLRQAGEAAWAGVQGAGNAVATGVRETGEALGAWLEEAASRPEEDPEGDVADALAQPELVPPRELLDPLISDIVTRSDGEEYLTGGGVDVVYYAQTDEKRAEEKYGTDPLSTHGCGPTAMAMAVSSLTEETVDPAEMARTCVDGGYWCKGHGSYLSIVQGVAKTYGLQCETLDPADLDEDGLYTRLASGDIAVALMGSGHFTKKGHFILLRGVTLSGDILVADPASRDRSLIPWDLSLIVSELSPSRTNGAPLWLLSPPSESLE